VPVEEVAARVLQLLYFPFTEFIEPCKLQLSRMLLFFISVLLNAVRLSEVTGFA
jgi:hypothetical protein